jgi:hypothetical protein
MWMHTLSVCRHGPCANGWENMPLWMTVANADTQSQCEPSKRPYPCTPLAILPTLTVWSLFAETGTPLIEDAAESLGSFSKVNIPGYIGK